jgi:hypothetical protein
MPREPREPPSVDALFAELLRAGENRTRIRELLEERQPDTPALLGALRRAVPVQLLEMLGTTPPWSRDARVLGGVVLNPRCPRSLALQLLPSLFWRDLAEVAASYRLPGPVRARAETVLKEMLPDLRIGERVTLAKIATPPVLVPLLADGEEKVTTAALINPRLREEDLVTALRQDTVARSLIDAIAASRRWSQVYGVRVALVLQPRTPLSLALAQLSSLVRRDLLRVAEAKGLRPLVKAAALRVAEEGGA